jgi:small subunit ribosomal protein S15
MQDKNRAKPDLEEVYSDDGLEIEVKKETKKSKETKEVKEPKVKIDVVKKIVELHNEGLPASKIGLILKNEFNIYNIKKYSGKSISEILKDNKLESEIPEDLLDLLKRAVKLLKHMKINKKDTTAKRGYQITVSKIRALSKYYKRTHKLPKDWNYSEDKAIILMK